MKRNQIRRQAIKLFRLQKSRLRRDPSMSKEMRQARTEQLAKAMGVSRV